MQLALDSMTEVALFLDMEKMFDIRCPDDMLVEGTFQTAGGLKIAIELFLQRKAS